MKATFNPQAKRKFTLSHRREKSGFHKEIVALVPSPYSKDEMHAVVTIRLYWPGFTTCYACAWIQHKKPFGKTPEGYDATNVSGSESSGGYGYDKGSAAAAGAILNAGFELSECISGRGESCIREAVLAVAKAAGWNNARLHTSHP